MSGRRGRPFRYAADIRRDLEILDRQEEARTEAWIKGRLARMPLHWGAAIADEHRKRGGSDVAAANAWLLGATEEGGRGLVPLSASEDDIRTAAKVAANEARGRAQVVRGGGADVFESMAHTCERWGVEPAVPRMVDGKPDIMPSVRRMLCRRWWLRRLRVAVGQRCEAAAIKAGMVRRGKWCYVSQDAVVRRLCQKERQRQAIGRALLEDTDTGEQIDLDQVVSGSVSNPAIKRGELMVRIRGFDEVAQGEGWACEFWTLTAPSRFHAQTTAGGRPAANPVYDGSSPREAQNYLVKLWARARAAWQRRGLQVVGLRTVEPHHDATPHWHLIAYGPEADLQAGRDLLKGYALQDSPGEAGAEKRRFVWLKAKGLDGAAYAAKYLAKNIDGRGLEGERDREAGGKVADTVQRVEAWAAVWRIRQFQFWGAPAVTVWRTLRKIRQACADAAAAIERARMAADRASWADFWKACVDGDLVLLKEDRERLTQYGDEAARRVVGVGEESGEHRALLDLRAWVVKWGGRVVEGAAGRRSVPLVPCL
ncbi:replication endonuclease [Accumulibacter sp.]|uniref:replication endonuclease n=1 Tax=Accumulibacter sp. TaxID=2053492 RepID=UPI001AD523BB|nr:replication endonuclease [Accumulibacter sp.]MBN8454841.1 replication endonuclease [Accumulibacter sp.]